MGYHGWVERWVGYANGILGVIVREFDGGSCEMQNQMTTFIFAENLKIQ